MQPMHALTPFRFSICVSYLKVFMILFYFDSFLFSFAFVFLLFYYTTGFHIYHNDDNEEWRRQCISFGTGPTRCGSIWCAVSAIRMRNGTTDALSFSFTTAHCFSACGGSAEPSPAPFHILECQLFSFCIALTWYFIFYTVSFLIFFVHSYFIDIFFLGYFIRNNLEEKYNTMEAIKTVMKPWHYTTRGTQTTMVALFCRFQLLLCSHRPKHQNRKRGGSRCAKLR